jgi:hypothetical protein
VNYGKINHWTIPSWKGLSICFGVSTTIPIIIFLSLLSIFIYDSNNNNSYTDNILYVTLFCIISHHQ